MNRREFYARSVSISLPAAPIVFAVTTFLVVADLPFIYQVLLTIHVGTVGLSMHYHGVLTEVRRLKARLDTELADRFGFEPENSDRDR